ncbi:MAG: ADP-ribosylglycohydrolase family protein [Lentisphaerae bacterium]|nr:ADP-ribosylglycohydrolase family protein [Lentisphaerota bacterium]
MNNIWLRWTKEDVRTELLQIEQEGRVVDTVKVEFDRLLAPDVPEDATFQDEVNALLDKTYLLPTKPDYPYEEPSDLEEIRANRPDGPRVLSCDLNESEKKSRIAGAWLGRCAGCLLGKPIEGVRSPKLYALLDRAGQKEITDYLWRLPGLKEEDYRELGFAGLLNYRNIKHMPEDDDTNYTVAGMALVKSKGIGFTPTDMANFWMANLPIHHVCTAERVAYRNFVNNIEPPGSAGVRNPYREWIGAQIRADFFGYVAAGRPELAAELAWRDACMSHVKNGIYGEMWVAAMLAAAFVETDIRRVIDIGLSEIPVKSRLTEAIHDVLAWHETKMPYVGAVQQIHERWDENKSHDWCHTISNAQIVALALLYGEGDFEKIITRSVYPCFDTDCNGATVGSIAGMMLGVESLPSKWTSVMNDTIYTGLTGYHVSKISQLSDEMYKLYAASEKTGTS